MPNLSPVATSLTHQEAVNEVSAKLNNATPEQLEALLNSINPHQITFLADGQLTSYPFADYKQWLSDNKFIEIEEYNPESYFYRINGHLHNEEHFCTIEDAKRDAFYTYVVLGLTPQED